MGSKFKPRQQKKPRSFITRDMILNNKGGPMRDRRDRRAKERDDIRNFIDEEEDYQDDPRPRNAEW
jgi:hypothetical protein